jgi:hypothetical protein
MISLRRLLTSDLQADAAPPANQFAIGVDHADDGIVEAPPDQIELPLDQVVAQNAGVSGMHCEEYGEQDDIADVDARGPGAVGTNVLPDM